LIIQFDKGLEVYIIVMEKIEAPLRVVPSPKTMALTRIATLLSSRRISVFDVIA
jgi:hypothetical protein